MWRMAGLGAAGLDDGAFLQERAEVVGGAPSVAPDLGEYGADHDGAMAGLGGRGVQGEGLGAVVEESDQHAGVVDHDVLGHAAAPLPPEV
jgi:hypothetical protein